MKPGGQRSKKRSVGSLTVDGRQQQNPGVWHLARLTHCGCEAMSHCRLRIQVSSKSATPSASGETCSLSSPRLTTLSNVEWSTDSTVLNVLDQVTVPAEHVAFLLLNSDVGPDSIATSTEEKSIQRLLTDGNIAIWDCTVFPKIDISDKCRNHHFAHSTTLFSAGWYPSGRLQILPTGCVPQAPPPETFDEFGSSDAINSRTNQQQGQHEEEPRLLPSQVLHAVTQRFSDTNQSERDGGIDDEANARKLRQQNEAFKIEANKERIQKLDQRIQRLMASGKCNPVKDQVRRMLVKSRASGNDKLRENDRIYLHCILLQDETGDDLLITTTDFPNETYRFFSIQDTVGRAIDSIAETEALRLCLPTTATQAEMLVYSSSYSSNAEPCCRLPATMRFYEALAHSFLSGTFDTVIVRWYNPEVDRPSLAANVTDMPATASLTSDLASPSLPTDELNKANPPPDSSTHKQYNFDSPHPWKAAVPQTTCSRLLDALRDYDQRTAGNGTSKAKQVSNAAKKVRQMQIKSKAKGDSKRVTLPNRFFLELATIRDDTASNESVSTVLSVAPIFVSQTDTVDRFVRDGAFQQAETNDSLWELLFINHKHGGLLRIATSSDEKDSTTWNCVTNDGIVNNFDRIVLRLL